MSWSVCWTRMRDQFKWTLPHCAQSRVGNDDGISPKIPTEGERGDLRKKLRRQGSIVRMSTTRATDAEPRPQDSERQAAEVELLRHAAENELPVRDRGRLPENLHRDNIVPMSLRRAVKSLRSLGTSVHQQMEMTSLASKTSRERSRGNGSTCWMPATRRVTLTVSRGTACEAAAGSA